MLWYPFLAPACPDRVAIQSAASGMPLQRATEIRCWPHMRLFGQQDLVQLAVVVVLHHEDPFVVVR